MVEAYLHPTLQELLQLDLKPVQLEVAWVIRFSVRATIDSCSAMVRSCEIPLAKKRRTFIGVVEVHCVETYDCELIRDYFFDIVAPALKDLQVREWNKVLPDAIVWISMKGEAISSGYSLRELVCDFVRSFGEQSAVAPAHVCRRDRGAYTYLASKYSLRQKKSGQVKRGGREETNMS